MIVKNSSEFHKTHPNQHLNINQHLRSHSQNQMPTQSKPYFLQGFQLAREFLVHLKKQKQQQLNYSPIINKNGKISSETLNLQNQRSSDKNSSKLSKKTAKIQKFRTVPPQNQIDENYQGEQQASIQTMKFKQSPSENQNSMKLHKQKIKQKQKRPQNIQNEQQFQELFKDQANQFKAKSKQSRIKTNQPIPQKIHRNNQFKKQIQFSETQINEIGKKLQQVNNQIQNYEIIFENLCDCYRANQSIVHKNNKLKKQSMRLQQQRQEIMGKIQLINKQCQEIDLAEKKTNQIIKKTVQQYVRQICIYNQNQEIQLLKSEPMQQQQYCGDSQQNDQQLYTDGLNLNYKRLKTKFEEKQKKKSTLQPKKTTKGVSFQQQIDVITKYYQSQLTNI